MSEADPEIAAWAGIGPGRLVLIVGPSGAGKDTLIDAAREALQGDPRIVFARRVVTRPPSPHEDHDSLDEDAFEAARAGFALAWEAHGLRYGVPAAIDDQVRSGRVVVVNASRTVVALARERYAQARIVLVDAPAEVRAARVAGRGRDSDGDIAARLERLAVRPSETGPPDVVIVNDRSIEAGVRALLDALGV